MSYLNRLCGGVLEVLLWPFRTLPPLAGLAFISLLTAVAVLLVYRKTSNQEGITAVRRKIVASLLEMRLFKDDLVVVLRAQARVIRDSFGYFRHSLVPLAWILVPLVLLFMQLDRVYGFFPLDPGEAAIVSVRTSGSEIPGLEAGPGLAVETPPLRIPNSTEINWRVRGLEAGEHVLTVRIGGYGTTKTVVVGSGATPLAATRPGSGIIDQLVNPGEEPIPSEAPVERIRVRYRHATVSFLGWQVHWVVPFLTLTILFGFALQKPMGVKL
jgi:hypothetical protein